MSYEEATARYQYDPYILTAISWLTPFYSIYWLTQNWNFDSILTLLCISWFIGINSTIFVHRAWTHRAWVPNTIVNVLGLFFYTIRCVGNSIGWAAMHRLHHRYSDTSYDPHSPLNNSRLKIQFLNYFSEIRLSYVTDLLRDRYQMYFAKYYWHINVIWWLLLLVISTDLLSLWIAVLGISITKMHTINSLGHAAPKWALPLGGKDSNNVGILAIINIDNGEAWHYNHHLDPANWNFSRKWYQLDPAALVLRLLFMLRLGTPRDN